MTPERQAAEQIARTLYVLRPADGELRWPDDWEQRATDTHREAYRGYGRACIEAISDAGLVILPAGRIADLLDANNREVDRRRAAMRALRLCLPHMIEAVESVVSGHSLAFDWQSGQPLPADCEPEAVLMAADAEAAIAAAKAVLGEAADA